MTGRYHSYSNSAIVPVAVLGLIFYLGFGWEYLLAIPVGIYFSTFPDIDASMTPARWKLTKFLIQAALLFVGIASAAIVVHFAMNYMQTGDRTNSKHALYALAVLLGYFLVYAYSKSKQGRFLFAHRGFTHTLIPPVLVFLCFKACRGFIGNENQLINYGARIGCIILIGMLIGILGHIFMDGLCKDGVPILFPITKKNIHWGFAKTSDSKAKDHTHISCKIYTYVTMTVFYILGLLMALTYYGVIKINF